MTSPAPRSTVTEEVARSTPLLDALPTLPLVAVRLGEILHSPRASIGQVAELISTDPSVSAKLLRLVNSAYFGIPGGVTEVAKAIPFIGFNTIYQLVVSVTVLETLRTPAGGVFDPRPMWRHSLAVAAAARVIAEDLHHPDPGSMFTAGLLHDMGEIALAKIAPDRYLQSRALIETEGMSAAEAEAQSGLPLHDRIGGDLARRWRLPASLIGPIESHHVVRTPSLRARLTAAARTGAEIVAVADLIGRDAEETAGRAIRPVGDDAETRALLDDLGLSADQRDSLHHRVMRQLERSKPFLDLLE